MKRKILFTLIFFLLALTMVSAANCPPGIPKVYSGDVYDGSGFFNQLLDDAEYPLRAIMGSDVVGIGSVFGGSYSIKIEPCFGNTGDISFIINGIEADENGEYIGQEDWGNEELLDLIFDPKPPISDTCGDNAIQLGEECDGINLGGRNANDCGVGWEGIISCNSCEIDYSACTLADFCGDAVCNNGESCSSCSGDCGACPVTGGSTGSGGGGGGGGGFSPVPVVNSTNTTNLSNETLAVTFSHDDGNSEEEKETYIEETKPFFSRMTGAVTGFSQVNTGIGAIIIIIVLAVLIIFISIIKKRSKTKDEKK